MIDGTTKPTIYPEIYQLKPVLRFNFVRNRKLLCLLQGLLIIPTIATVPISPELLDEFFSHFESWSQKPETHILKVMITAIVKRGN